MSTSLKTVTRQGAGRQSISSKKDWCTPPKYVDAVRGLFGGSIDLDPCSNKHSVVGAKIEYCSPVTDGLKESWCYKTIYVNPPYGNDKESGTRIRDWLAKCAHANERYDSEVLALVPVATNTSHWKLHVFTKARAICFLYDTRLKFLEDGRHGGKGAPMSCAMIYWGNNLQKFNEIFGDYGAVVDISNLFGKRSVGNQRVLRLIA
jgi:DNA N-6-adenine-methyltransferase (Dam)